MFSEVADDEVGCLCVERLRFLLAQEGANGSHIAADHDTMVGFAVDLVAFLLANAYAFHL